MTLKRDDLIEEIASAFPATRQRAFASVVNSCRGDEPIAVTRAFADKLDWTSLDPKWLDKAPDGSGSALSFLSDEASCFFMPAYMIADLRGQLQTADPAFHLTHGFDDFYRDVPIRSGSTETHTDDAGKRWEQLTARQVQAIVHYLEWRIEDRGIDLEFAADEALRAYWYRRSSSTEE